MNDDEKFDDSMVPMKKFSGMFMNIYSDATEIWTKDLFL